MEPYDGLPQPWIRQRALAGDASKRQYYRVWDRFDDSAILVHYPGEYLVVVATGFSE